MQAPEGMNDDLYTRLQKAFDLDRLDQIIEFQDIQLSEDINFDSINLDMEKVK